MKRLVLVFALLASAASATSILEFRSSEAVWYTRNDGVMGGVSSSAVRIQNGVLEFTGRISLENGGGFSGIRTRAKRYDLIAYQGVRFRVRGDGKRYAFQLGNSVSSGVSYWFDFQTVSGRWIEVRAPFSAFVPRRSGEVIRARRLDTSRVLFFGVITRTPRPERFKLELDWIRGY